MRRKGGTNVGHDHHSVSVRGGILHDSEAHSVEKVFIVLDFGVFSSEFSACSKEHSIGHFPAKKVFEGQSSAVLDT